QGRVFWGADEECRMEVSPRVIVNGYDGPPCSGSSASSELMCQDLSITPPALDYVPDYQSRLDPEVGPEGGSVGLSCDGGDGDDEPSMMTMMMMITNDEDEEPFKEVDDDEEGST
ncbi:hypothetical protein Tco_1208119, partial [Tanacetum coccineum]